MSIKESQTVEFKEAWRDDYLKTICAFANTECGTLYVGINDKGEVVGVDNTKKLIEDIPNKIISVLNAFANVKLMEIEGKEIVEITVPKSTFAVSFKGQFYVRSGSTTQELKGRDLQNLLLKVNNLSWDEIGVERAKMTDIDPNTVELFIRLATKENRLPAGVNGNDIEKLFRNLNLINDNGELTRAALLLFSKEPTRFFHSAFFKVGRFRGMDETDLIIQDKIEGNLFVMVDKVVDLLRAKYLMSPISYEGMLRIETLEIPEKALRETIINALIHRDYASSASISLRVFDSKIVVWNDGELNKISIADLKKTHDSYPRNPLLAKIFFMSGYIEAWGRGIKTIVDETVKSGLPEPEFAARQNGLEVTYQRNPMRLSEKGLNENPKVELSVRQQKAVEYVKEHGSISNKIYQEINNVSKPTATRDLAEMVAFQIFESQGSGRGLTYILSAHNRLIIGSIKGSKMNVVFLQLMQYSYYG